MEGWGGGEGEGEGAQTACSTQHFEGLGFRGPSRGCTMHLLCPALIPWAPPPCAHFGFAAAILGPPPCTYFGFAAAILCSSLSVSNVVYSMLCSAAYLMSLGRLQGCAKMMRD